jgi:hypothetical protein
VNRAAKFFSCNWNMQMLFLEAFFTLGWARIIKSWRFSKIAPSLGEQMDETSFISDVNNKDTIKNVSLAINLMSRYTFWESMCLVKAIAAMKMLEKRGIESTIYFGTAKDEAGKLIAHAWLRSGSFFITGFDVMEKFTVVNKFAKRINR